MKRAIFGMVAVNLVLVGILAIVFAEPPRQLVTITEPHKTDEQAIKDWWRDLNGDDPEFRVTKISLRKNLKDFELDVGHRLRPDWINASEWLKEYADGSVAVTATIGSGIAREPRFFVIKKGKVIYHAHAFRAAR